MFSRRLFLSRLSIFAGGASAAPVLTSASTVDILTETVPTEPRTHRLEAWSSTAFLLAFRATRYDAIKERSAEHQATEKRLAEPEAAASTVGTS